MINQAGISIAETFVNLPETNVKLKSFKFYDQKMGAIYR